MTDDLTDDQLHATYLEEEHALFLLEKEWLADEAAQAEYRSWLDSLDSLNHETTKGQSWDVTHPIPAAETSHKPRQART